MLQPTPLIVTVLGTTIVLCTSTIKVSYNLHFAVNSKSFVASLVSKLSCDVIHCNSAKTIGSLHPDCC